MEAAAKTGTCVLHGYGSHRGPAGESASLLVFLMNADDPSPDEIAAAHDGVVPAKALKRYEAWAKVHPRN